MAWPFVQLLAGMGVGSNEGATSLTTVTVLVAVQPPQPCSLQARAL